MTGRTLDSKVEVHLDLAADLWPVEVDTTQLETALLNAAINARDAMPEGGRLTLKTLNLPETEQVCIEVADTGEGMSAEVLERVFEPFFTTKQVGKGTGLGLSQIHGFAAQTGGTAEIHSVPGEGTQLRLILPRSKERPEEGAAETAAPTMRVGLRVLLVEDNDHVRQFAETLLTELGCEVLAAACGEEALDIRGRERVGLLFSDVVMPGMTGVELATRVREHFPGLPVLLASGYSEEVFRGAAADFKLVPKPYGLSALNDGIAAVVGPGPGPDQPEGSDSSL